MIAHMRKSDYKIQTVQEHLDSVSLLAGTHGKKAGFQAMAKLSGLLHDMGKNTSAFSTYIENAVKETGKPLEKIDHSTAGAKFLYENYYTENSKASHQLNKTQMSANFVVEIVGMVILSHHTGLQNFMEIDGGESDFYRRVYSKELPYYEDVCAEFLAIPGNKEMVDSLLKESINEIQFYFDQIRQLFKTYSNQNPNKSTSHFLFLSTAQKFIFSCLIDADRTDSRRFNEADTSSLEKSHQSFFKESYKNLIHSIKKFQNNSNASQPINQLRSEMSEQCEKLADRPSSILQLSIPTGGGKTFASLRYALKHADLYHKDRIIYIVPYTTILEQNAEAVREIIQNKEMVIEHHANIIDEINEGEEPDYYQRTTAKRMQLARDNWDFPIIFTTMVQFLDTFYAKGTRKARRLHNLTNAVIIFDEIQSVPVKHISLFNSAVNFLHHFGKSSILLCTATQPSLTKTKYPLFLNDDNEIINDLPSVVKAFKRVEIKNIMKEEPWTAEEISSFTINELKDKNTMLIILNTKKAVLNVYEQLKENQGYIVYHLSTSMCPQHRKDILSEVNEKLKKKKEKVICVSTQLIEAGVDISFETVIRSLAGLDSVAQAAGRCNRNREKDIGMVYVINAKDESLSKLPEILLGQRVVEEDVLSRKEIAEDLLSPLAIKTYFDFFISKAGKEIQMKDKKLNIPLIDLINTGQKYFDAIPLNNKITLMRSMYKTLETHFEVIEAPTVGVIVPYDKGEEVIANLNEEIYDPSESNRLLREAQLYSVNVYRHTLQQLVEEDLIYPLFNEGIYALRDIGYHKDYGLSLIGEGQAGLSIY